MTETVRPLELLHRVAETVGATVCLTSTADQRANFGTRRPFTRRTNTRLSKLVVVIPLAIAQGGADVTRWRRLARGDVIAQADLIDAVPLDQVAEQLVEQLTARIDQLRRRA